MTTFARSPHLLKKWCATCISLATLATTLGLSVYPASAAVHPVRNMTSAPQKLYTVAADAFPPHQGFGDSRFGAVQAFEAPAAADDLHVGWERVQVAWSELQPHGPGLLDPNATPTDATLDKELAHGRHLVGVILDVPGWAAVNPKDGAKAVPQNINLPWNDARNYFGQFVYQVVRHYAGRIDTFNILNEVNIKTGDYFQFAGGVVQYAQILRVAYLAAHAANPHVSIHIYGDSMYNDYGLWFSKTIDALAAFPNAAANNYFFDAADVHLYISILQWKRLLDIWHHVMQSHGFDKPIWMSETNVLPRNDYVRPSPSFSDNAPLDVQSAFIVDSFAVGLSLLMPRVEIFTLRDPSATNSLLAGLVRYNFSKRPAYAAFKTVNQWFAGVTRAAYHPGSEATRAADNKHPLFRVVLERPASVGVPARMIQVIWDQAGTPIDASVPALASSATVVRPDGSTSTATPSHGSFAFHLAAATDENPLMRGEYKIGGTPLIVVQDLQANQHAPALAPIFVERDRGAGATAALGAVSSIATAPDLSGRRVLADTAHDRVLVENAQGQVAVRIGSTGGAPGQFRGPAAVAIGSDATLYVADQGNARIQEFSLTGQLLGGFGSYVDPTTPGAALHAPSALAVAPDNSLYVVDEAQDAVLHFDRAGHLLGRWGVLGHGSGQFDGPSDIAVAPNGAVYVADTLNNRVAVFDAHGAPLGQIGSGDAGASLTTLHWPVAIAFTQDGRVAVSDAGNARIVVAARPQTLLGSIAAPALALPGGVAVAPDGSFFVSDTTRNRIIQLDATGHQLAAFGAKGQAPGSFLQPLGLAFGPDGALYVADEGNNRIQVLTATGKVVRTFGHQGNAPGAFLGPHQVSVAPDGSVWVADTFNARVQHLSATGAPLTPIITHVNGAYGVAADGQGGVYYSAYYGQRVYHYAKDGQTTVVGSVGSGSQEFNHPSLLASSSDHKTIYIVDQDNQRVQVLRNGRVIDYRGGASMLTTPVAVAVGPDGAVVVLDAGGKKLVRFRGTSDTGFTSIPAPSTPLGLTADAAGVVAAGVNPLTGLTAQTLFPVAVAAAASKAPTP